MSLFKKLLLLGRKTLADTEDALDQATIVAQLEQAVRDSKSKLAQADNARADLRAKRNGLERETKELEAEVSKWTATAQKFKAADDLDKAKQCIENRRTEQAKLDAKMVQLQTIVNAIDTLDAETKTEKLNIERISGEVEILKSEKAMLDAQESIQQTMGAGRNSSSSAVDALARAKTQQAARRDKIAANKEMSVTDDLVKQADALGNTASIEDELANL